MSIRSAAGAILALTITFGSALSAQAGLIDFTSGIPVSPDNFDPFDKTDMGVTFSFTPIDNLVGGARWIGGPDKITFGGGGGSSLAFDFVADADVTLDTYSIGSIFHLGNPDFDILDGITTLSMMNSADVDGTFPFAGGPISLTSGTVYSLQVNTFGAGIQSAFTGWNFSVTPSNGFVPLPPTWPLMLGGLGVLLAMPRRREAQAGR